MPQSCGFLFHVPVIKFRVFSALGDHFYIGKAKSNRINPNQKLAILMRAALHRMAGNLNRMATELLGTAITPQKTICRPASKARL